jgi:hypothetical protein
VLNVMGAIFVAVIFIGTSNSSTVQPVVAIERTVMYRCAHGRLFQQHISARALHACMHGYMRACVPTCTGARMGACFGNPSLRSACMHAWLGISPDW